VKKPFALVPVATVATVVVTLVVALACTGCTERTGGASRVAPPASSATSPATTPAPATATAPRVPAPLDVSTFLDRPCSVLSADQLASLKLSPTGDPDTSSDIATIAGPGCYWQNGDQMLATKITLMTANKHGLADSYRGHEQGDYPVWEPTTVAGYPAVFNDAVNLRATGSCSITVGVSDTMTILVGEEDSSDLGPRACDRAKQVAAMVVHTVKAGG
jgi:uncharacterized protein DUF3558